MALPLQLLCGMECLVVDDNPEQAELVGRALARGGHNVTCVEGGMAAIAALHGRAFDVLLVDLEMPDISGLDVIREARTLAPGTCIVVVSGSDAPPQVLSALQAGATGYVIKTDVSRLLPHLTKGCWPWSPRVEAIVKAHLQATMPDLYE